MTSLPRKRWILALAGLALLVIAIPPSSGAVQRVKLTGEVIDSWCQTTGIMYALGTAHHQCAIWCAVGGIPVGLRTSDGTIYTILKVDKDQENVANPRLLRLQTHEVSAEGDVIERNGLRYLLIDGVMDDHGIVNQTHADYAIQPFGE